MDPANPVRQVNDRRLTQVQRWVISVLAVTTILHLSVGLVIARLVPRRERGRVAGSGCASSAARSGSSPRGSGG